MPIGPPPPTGFTEAKPGDVLYGKLRPYLSKSLLVEEPTYASTELLCIRPAADTTSRWLAYLVQSRPFLDWAVATSEGAKMPRTSWAKVGDFKCPGLALGEQRAIADFLDAETARIDALISKKRRLIELLDERLGAEIRLTLRSLDVPSLPLRRKWRVVDCKHRTAAYVEDGYPVVSPGDATPGRLDLSRCHRFVDDADYLDLIEPPRQPRVGDIIYSRNASIGIASYVDTADPFCMGQDVCLITSDDQDQLYLTYVLNSLGIDQLDEAKIGSTFSRINVAQILDLLIPWPEPSAQRQLAAQFDRIVTSHDRLRASLSRQIELLVEHRQALITAAVTGETVVPGVAA
ncbi:MAG: restriction endonuclease subunit S [Acidimicrobiales bacterium]